MSRPESPPRDPPPPPPPQEYDAAVRLPALRRLAPGMVLQHLCDFRRQQGHEVAQKIQLGVVKAPILADRQYRPAVQKSRLLC
jgi:hypothetical protein